MILYIIMHAHAISGRPDSLYMTASDSTYNMSNGTQAGVKIAVSGPGVERR